MLIRPVTSTPITTIGTTTTMFAAWVGEGRSRRMDQSAESSEEGPKQVAAKQVAVTGPWPRFHDLYRAYKAARIGKPASSHQIRFQSHEAMELVSLHRDIHWGAISLHGQFALW